MAEPANVSAADRRVAQILLARMAPSNRRKIRRAVQFIRVCIDIIKRSTSRISAVDSDLLMTQLQSAYKELINENNLIHTRDNFLVARYQFVQMFVNMIPVSQISNLELWFALNAQSTIDGIGLYSPRIILLVQEAQRYIIDSIKRARQQIIGNLRRLPPRVPISDENSVRSATCRPVANREDTLRRSKFALQSVGVTPSYIPITDAYFKDNTIRATVSLTTYEAVDRYESYILFQDLFIRTDSNRATFASIYHAIGTLLYKSVYTFQEQDYEVKTLVILNTWNFGSLYPGMLRLCSDIAARYNANLLLFPDNAGLHLDLQSKDDENFAHGQCQDWSLLLAYYFAKQFTYIPYLFRIVAGSEKLDSKFKPEFLADVKNWYLNLYEQSRTPRSYARLWAASGLF